MMIAVRAAIYSFGSVLVVPWKQTVTLPCQSVGKPEPTVVWKRLNQQVKPTSKVSLQIDGSLQITDLYREDSGNYSCMVENRHGSDQITHRLSVQGTCPINNPFKSFSQLAAQLPNAGLLSIDPTKPISI